MIFFLNILSDFLEKINIKDWIVAKRRKMPKYFWIKVTVKYPTTRSHASAIEAKSDGV